MEQWKEYKLGDISNMKYGKLPPKQNNGSYPIWSGYRNVGFATTYNCRKGTIIVVARGVGGTGDVKISSEDCFLTNLSIAVELDNKICEPLYFYYKYKLSNLRYLDTGSAQSQITIDDLKRLSLKLPPLEEQKRITEILSSIDYKIELNRRINILSIVSGFAYKGEYLGKGESLLLGMGCVSYSELFLEKGMRPYAGEFPERYSVEAGDIVLATRQQSDNLPILGMPAIVPQKFKGKKMVFGANLYKVVPKSPEFPIDYIYWLLKTPAYIRHIRSCQTGTTVRMITKANIEDYAFMCPCKEQRNQISKLLWDIEMKIVLNRRINDNLMPTYYA